MVPSSPNSPQQAECRVLPAHQDATRPLRDEQNQLPDTSDVQLILKHFLASALEAAPTDDSNWERQLFAASQKQCGASQQPLRNNVELLEQNVRQQQERLEKGIQRLLFSSLFMIPVV